LDEGGVDPVLGIRYVKEIYDAEDPDWPGRPTVPIVVDVRTGRGVNSDYFRLTNYLETVWAPFHKEGAPDLYPEGLREEIDALNAVIFTDINSGVYKAGFAHSQVAYERAYQARLDWLEERLEERRYLFGDTITDSDVRLYTTLVRFDAAYYPVFNTNRNRLVDFPNLWGYARDLYQNPGFGDTTDLAAIRSSYHASPHLRGFARNPYGIHPKGQDEAIWLTPMGGKNGAKDEWELWRSRLKSGKGVQAQLHRRRAQGGSSLRPPRRLPATVLSSGNPTASALLSVRPRVSCRWRLGATGFCGAPLAPGLIGR
jgi:putative glutathione S-transferase